jgi:hypothetical protein
VIIKKVLDNTTDVSHVEPLSEDYMVKDATIQTHCTVKLYVHFLSSIYCIEVK